MTLGRRLTRQLVPAGLQALLVVAAMVDRAVGAGVVGGILVGAVVTAIRDDRRARREAAESEDLDRRLVAALAKRRPIDVPVAVRGEEEQLS